MWGIANISLRREMTRAAATTLLPRLRPKPKGKNVASSIKRASTKMSASMEGQTESTQDRNYRIMRETAIKLRRRFLNMRT